MLLLLPHHRIVLAVVTALVTWCIINEIRRARRPQHCARDERLGVSARGMAHGQG